MIESYQPRNQKPFSILFLRQHAPLVSQCFDRQENGDGPWVKRGSHQQYSTRLSPARLGEFDGIPEEHIDQGCAED
jgi:hypothetical protein